jgi:hypothetical protein
MFMSRTHSDTLDFRDAEGLGDLLQGAVLGAEQARFLLRFDFASVSHFPTVKRV